MKPFLDMADRSAVMAYIRARCAIMPPSEGGCWDWVAAKNSKGYPRFNAQGKQYLAHREAFKASGRRIPDGWTVDHLCQNTACCNPEHLSTVSREENTRRARNAFWVSWMKENVAALNVVQKLGGSVIEPVPSSRGNECT
ncbi:HNH endonuclease signature motif containing protein [Streptomyces sp. NPDC000851]